MVSHSWIHHQMEQNVILHSVTLLQLLLNREAFITGRAFSGPILLLKVNPFHLLLSREAITVNQLYLAAIKFGVQATMDLFGAF